MTTAFEPHWVQRSGTAVRRVIRPTSVRAVLEALHDDPSRRVVAGGTDLIVDLARTSGEPIELVDVSAVTGFRSIVVEPDEFVLGGGVTHNQVVADPRLVEGALPLAQACLEIGSPQLRNRATVAGNLATASPANDSISALMALGASVELQRIADGAITTRTVPVEEFFVDVRATVIAPDELITSIRVPRSDGRRGIWVKLGLRKAQAISVVHAGLVVDLDPDGTVRAARIALGSVAPTVVLAPAAAQLVGGSLETAAVERVASEIAAHVEPIGDGRATADYRRNAVETVVRRGLSALASDRQAAQWPNRVPTLGASGEPTPFHADINDETIVAIRVNGEAVAASGAVSLTLLDWLRDHAGTGTKEGCAEGECGACTVILDGAAVMSCLTPAAQADGAHVTTVEGLAPADSLSAMQQSFVDAFAVQCGYCIPGFVVSATTLVDELDRATDEEIEFGLSGNLCRCTGYYSIMQAVRQAGAES